MYINIDKETKKYILNIIQKYYHNKLHKYFIRPIKYTVYYNTVIVFYILVVNTIKDNFYVYIGYFIYDYSNKQYLSMDTMNSYLIQSHNRLPLKYRGLIKKASFKSAVSFNR